MLLLCLSSNEEENLDGSKDYAFRPGEVRNPVAVTFNFV